MSIKSIIDDNKISNKLQNIYQILSESKNGYDDIFDEIIKNIKCRYSDENVEIIEDRIISIHIDDDKDIDYEQSVCESIVCESSDSVELLSHLYNYAFLIKSNDDFIIIEKTY